MKPALFNIIAIATLTLFSQGSFAQCDTSKPADLQVDQVHHNSARFSWDPHQLATGYDYAVSTSTTPPPDLNSTINTTLLQKGLAPNTYYCFHVRAHCSGGGYSQWQSTCFTTAPAPSAVAQVTDEKINIYPNPAANYLSIETPSGRHTITIRDLVGKTILTIGTDRQTTTIDLSSVRQGLYFVTVSGEGYSRTQRITRQ